MVENKVEAFGHKMRELLSMERQAELDENSALLSHYSFKELEKRNMAVTKLFIKSVSTGVYGRFLVHLNRGSKNAQKDPEKASKSFQSGKLRTFSPGDIVGLFPADGSGRAPSNLTVGGG